MIVVADAGPLIALAKAEALDLLFEWCTPIHIPPAVVQETIEDGIKLGADDAPRLKSALEIGRLAEAHPKTSTLPIDCLIGQGEEEALLLAIDLNANWILVDDLDARILAKKAFRTAGQSTGIKGSLGVIVTAVQNKQIPPAQAIQKVEALSQRPDVWLSPALCERVIRLLSASLPE